VPGEWPLGRWAGAAGGSCVLRRTGLAWLDGIRTNVMGHDIGFVFLGCSQVVLRGLRANGVDLVIGLGDLAVDYRVISFWRENTKI
jgi:hypothetical protein